MPRTLPPRVTPAATWIVGTVLLAALSACAGEQPTGTPADGPGEHSSSHSADDPDDLHDGHDMAGMDLPAPPEDADWNLADATYLAMMIPHHRQALDLAELAETRAEDPRVLAIARAIEGGQSREIIVMATWLVDHGLPEPTLDDVEEMYAAAGSPSGMEGMLSPDQMTALADATGAEFDRLFLQGMIQHHRGALTMADDQLGGGEDVRVSEMASEVIATQNGEIQRMEELLGEQ